MNNRLHGIYEMGNLRIWCAFMNWEYAYICQEQVGDLLKVCLLGKHLTHSKVAFIVIVYLIVDSFVSYLFVKVICIILQIFSNIVITGTNFFLSDLFRFAPPL